MDFLRGAARAKGGVPIIALPSTAKNGTVSRIATLLQPGAGVVTSRGDVHYVVTEHGVAYLHGKTLRQRAEALIQVADPQFRAELERSSPSNTSCCGRTGRRSWFRPNAVHLVHRFANTLTYSVRVSADAPSRGALWPGSV